MKWRIGIMIVLVVLMGYPLAPEAIFADGSGGFVRWAVDPQGPSVEVRLISSKEWMVETTEFVFPYTPFREMTLWLPKGDLTELRLTAQGDTWATVSSSLCGLEIILAKTGDLPLEVHLRNGSEVIYNTEPGIRIFPGELESLFPGKTGSLDIWVEGGEKCQEVVWDFSQWGVHLLYLPLILEPSFSQGAGLSFFME